MMIQVLFSFFLLFCYSFKCSAQYSMLDGHSEFSETRIPVDEENRLSKIELKTNMYHCGQVINKYENNGVEKSFSLSNSNKTFYYDRELFIREVEVRGSNIKIEGINFTLGLIDKNNNGIFNEVNVDEVIIEIGKVDSLYLSDDNSWLYHINENHEVYFKVNNKSYVIRDIERNGLFLNLSSRSIENVTSKNINTNLFNVSLNAIRNRNTIEPLSKDKYKYIIAELWWAGCGGCLKAIPKINTLSTKYRNEILVIGLNHIDSKNVINKFIDNYSMLYPQYSITKSDLESLGPFCKSFPRAMLFDSKGNLISNDFDLRLINQLLK
jgi:thiol-disulfide isomerase/thioredoxin